MYLFTRMTRLAPGHLRDGTEWALEITQKVNQITSLDVGLWTPMLSPALGTLSWGTAVETLSDLEDADAKLSADAIFVDLVDQAAAVTIGGVDDETHQFVHNPATELNATHVAVVRAQIANGQFQRGVAVGAEIAQRATEVSGVPTAFLMAVTGAYAGCGWISAAASLRELEASEHAVNSDPEFLALLDGAASECYLPGMTTQSIWRRIV